MTTDRKLINDSESWKRLGRRWTAVLVAMLCSNCFLIVLAVAGYGGGTHNAISGHYTSPFSEVAGVEHGEETEAITAQAKRETTTIEQQNAVEPTDVAASALPPPTQAVPAFPSEVPANSSDEKLSANLNDSSKAVGESSIPDDAESVPLTKDEFVFANPPTTGGPVNFLVDGEVHSLSPGTYCRFVGNQPKRVIFHKGNEESDTELELAAGLFAFEVGSAGWELAPVDSKDSQKLLRRCRLATE